MTKNSNHGTPSFPASLLQRHPTLMALCVLYIPILLFIGPIILSSGYLFKGDVPFNFAPFTAAGMDQWKHGVIPFWSHFVQCGFPLLGDGMGALLYPPLMLVYTLFPLSIAYNVDTGIHFFIAALTMFLYCRNLKLGYASALLGSWIWIFTGPILGYAGSPALHALAWLPLIFLLIDRLFIAQVYFISVALLAVLYGLGWVGGLPQIPIYTSMASLFYLAFRLFCNKNIGTHKLISISGGWIAAVIVGIGFGLIQLLPTLEVGALSMRAGGVDYAFATSGSLFPAGLAGFIVPSWTRISGDWLAGPNVFVGYLVLGLILLTLHRKNDNKAIYFFWALLAIGCFLSFGKFNPLYKIIYHIPGLNFLRIPSRFLLFAQFSLSVLAAIGFNSLGKTIQGEEFKAKKIELLKKIAICLGTSTLLMIIGSLLLRIVYQPLFVFVQTNVQRSTTNNAYALREASLYHERIVTLFTNILASINPLQFETILSVVTAIGALSVLAFTLKSNSRIKTQYLLLPICLVNLLMFVPNPLKTVNEKVAPPSPIVEYLKKQKGLFRIYNVNYPENLNPDKWSQAKLDPSFNMFHKIDNAGVYSSLGNKRYFDFMGKLGAANLGFGIRPVTDTTIRTFKYMLDLMNVRFLTSDKPLDIPGLTLAPVAAPPFLYENRTVFPRAFLVPVSKTFKDPAALLDALHSPTFKPDQVVLLEDQPEKIPEEPVQILPPPVVASYENTKVTIDATGPGWLVLSDLYYPGWKAAVNGIHTKIFRANYVFRAIPLDAGKQRVVFSYSSSPFKKGLVVCFVSLGIVIALLVMQAIQSKKRR